MVKHKVRPPFAYFGGKYNQLEHILKHFPPHHTYVEVFGGAASVLLNKQPSQIEVYNDVNSGLVNFMRVLRDNETELIRRLSLTPYSRGEYLNCLHNWSNCDDPVERARMWYFVAATSYNGRFGHGFRVSSTQASSGMSAFVKTYYSNVASLYAVANRMCRAIIECLDFEEVFKRYDEENTLFYCDPPYVPDTRHRESTYEHEMSYKDHERLVGTLLSVKGMVVLSGYENELYRNTLERNGWSTVSYSVTTASNASASIKGPKRTETLWLSPSVQEKLFGHVMVT